MVQNNHQRIIIQAYIAHHQRTDRMGFSSVYLAEYRPNQQSGRGSDIELPQYTAQGLYMEHDLVRYLEQGEDRQAARR